METLIAYLASWMTIKYLSIYFVLTSFPIWWTIYFQRHLKGTPELNQKYWPFARTDYKNWNPIFGVIINGCLFFWFRYVGCWLVVIAIFVVAVTISFGHKQGTNVPKWRQKAIYYTTAPLFRLLIFIVGIVWISRDKKKKVDY